MDPFDAQLPIIEDHVPIAVTSPHSEPAGTRLPQNPSARIASSVNGVVIDSSADRDRSVDGPSPSKRARIEIVIPSAAGVLAGAVAGSILTWAGLAYT